MRRLHPLTHPASPAYIYRIYLERERREKREREGERERKGELIYIIYNIYIIIYIHNI